MPAGLLLISGALVAWALGARLSLLSDMRLRAQLLVFGALALQIPALEPGGVVLADGTLRLLHAGTYGLLILFVLVNIRTAGMWLLALGLLSNAVATFANGGQMPVSVEAWRSLGRNVGELVSTNAAAGPDTALPWLGNVIALAGVPRAGIISIGDVMILAGAIAFVYRSCVPAVDGSAALRLPALRSLRCPSLAPAARDLVRSPLAATVTVAFALAAAALGVLAGSLPTLFSARLGGQGAYGYGVAALGVGLLAGGVLTGFARQPSAARRAVGMALLLCAGAVHVLSTAETPATAYVALFAAGAAFGAAVPFLRSLPGDVPGLARVVGVVGIVAGIAAARVAGLADDALGLAVLSCLAAAGVALVSSLARRPERHQQREVPADIAPLITPQLDRPVPSAALAQLTADGPVVLALFGGGSPDPERLAMLDDLAVSGAAVHAVTASDTTPETLEGVSWMIDPTGAGFHALGLTRDRSGLFVLDRGAVLRLAFAEPQEGGWIPASIVRSRLSRMANAAA
jgi:hypothetical protein